MRTYILAAGLAAAALTTAQAEAATVCRQDSTGRTVATIAGAGIGAMLGRVVTGRHGGTAGAIVGGLAGGVAGNQLAKGDVKCDRAYGYYDESYRWHANATSDGALGYYTADGTWVDGPPNGYYDRDNRWVAFNSDATSAGYRDRDGRWVPVGASGYYAADGRWVGASAPGYYDRGRWVAGPVTGHYNSNGVWVSDTSYSQPAGGWAYQTQPGYYDSNGRWVAGQVTGYYDARGRWVTDSVSNPNGGNYANGYAPHRLNVADRAAKLQNRITMSRKKGMLSRREADQASAELASIRRDDYRMRHNGVLSERDSQYLQERLDRVAVQVRADREDGNNYPG